MIKIHTPHIEEEINSLETYERNGYLTDNGLEKLRELKEIQAYIAATGELIELLAEKMPELKAHLHKFTLS
jgi:hypothetical protein